jgi:ribonuclease HI
MNAQTYMFTDGSCSGRGYDMGAWGAVIVTQSMRKLLYGTMYPATVNRCELMPMIMGLHWISGNMDTRIPIRIYTDSEHTAQAIAGLFTPEENGDLWSAFQSAARNLKIACRWRERNSHPYMVLCDSVASTLRKGQIEIASRLFDDWARAENGLPPIALPQDEKYDAMEGVQNANSALR